MFMERSYNVNIYVIVILRENIQRYLLNVFILLGTILRLMLRNTAYMQRPYNVIFS